MMLGRGKISTKKELIKNQMNNSNKLKIMIAGASGMVGNAIKRAYLNLKNILLKYIRFFHPQEVS